MNAFNCVKRVFPSICLKPSENSFACQLSFKFLLGTNRDQKHEKGVVVGKGLGVG